ncbi:hypothetical protein K470DRAFT_219661 [Piedraia hortae CBS 480.64]|uniref:Uncharacterized protein n=1 Tax=Piedraia hortae CBS 480.64 TaxID=1314780 RepID=A0A6A7BWV7_9PEZI|nr:hypothetical protein K470DRAFT_219661 [Piedraia hortae CBS 480.64]
MPSPVRSLWYRWKALRLPWRKRFFVGLDLDGNTFWEFKDTISSQRLRRIVKHKNAAYFSDIQVSPQWMQWLRHARKEAPTIAEQQHEISRQATMKMLAERADERWKALPSYLDSPEKLQPQPTTSLQDSQAPIPTPDETRAKSPKFNSTKKGDTSHHPKGNPGDSWQPEIWTPDAAPRR